MQANARPLGPERQFERVEGVEQIIGTVGRQEAVHDVRRTLGRNLVDGPSGEKPLLGLVHFDLKSRVRRNEEPRGFGAVPLTERFLVDWSSAHLGPERFRNLSPEIVYAALVFPGGVAICTIRVSLYQRAVKTP
jgi:hypothetical protein